MLAAAVQAAYNARPEAKLLVTPINPAGNSFYVYVSQQQPLDLSAAGIYDITPAANVTLKIRAWGAGGGGGVAGVGATSNNANGGGGGYVEGDFTFIANTTYRIVVGSPGVTGSGNTGGAAGPFGSPGAGSDGNDNTFPQGGGSGGGFTGLFSSTTINQANAIIIAGGGGGGAGIANEAADVMRNGTAGGSTSSVQDVFTNTSALVVTAPTTTAAGANASNMTGASGTVGNYHGRGGGGGGYWGGGAFQGTTPDYGGVGGTGGISYIAPSVVAGRSFGGNLVTTSAYTAGRIPGNSNEAFRGTSGNGGQFNTNGSPGRFMLVAPTGTDPNFANVGVLLLMNGQNGTTSFFDVKGNTVFTYVSGTGSLSSSNAVWKFNGASTLFAGGDTSTVNQSLMYLNDSAAVQVGAGNFTIECWINPTTLAGHRSTICSKYAGNYNPRWVWLIGTTGYIEFVDQNAAGTNLFVLTSPSGLINAGNWYHVALVRNGTTISMYVNGILAASGNYAGDLSYGGAPFGIGQFINATSGYRESFRGYMDSFRLTKNIARYTSNFVPPTTEFPSV